MNSSAISLFSHDVVNILITIQVKLIRIKDAYTVFEGQYCYRSKASDRKALEEWTKDDAVLLCNEIRHGLGVIAAAIVTDFLKPLEGPAPPPAAINFRTKMPIYQYAIYSCKPNVQVYIPL